MPSAKLTVIALSLLAKTALALPLAQTSDLEVFVNAMLSATTGNAYNSCDTVTAQLGVSVTATGAARAKAFNTWATGYCFNAYHDTNTCNEISAYLATTYYAYISGYAGADLFASLGGARVARWHSLLTTLCGMQGCPSGACDTMYGQWSGFVSASAGISLSAVTHESTKINSLGLLNLFDTNGHASGGLLGSITAGLGIHLRDLDANAHANAGFITYDNVHVPHIAGLGLFGEGQANANAGLHLGRDISASAISSTAAHGAGVIDLSKGGLTAAGQGFASTVDSLKLGHDGLFVSGDAHASGSAAVHLGRGISNVLAGAGQGSGFLDVGKGGIMTGGQGSGNLADALNIGGHNGVTNVLNAAGQGSGFLDVSKGGIVAAGQSSGHLSDALHLRDSRSISNVLTGAGQGSGVLELNKGGLTAAGQGSGSITDALKVGGDKLFAGVAASGSGSGYIHAGRGLSNVLAGAGQGSGVLDIGKGGVTAAGQGSGFISDALKLGGGNKGLASLVSAQGSGAAYVHAERDISNILTGAGQGSGFLELGKGGLTAAGQGSGHIVDALRLGKTGEIVASLSGSGSGVLHAGRDISNVLAGAGQGSGFLELGKQGLTAAGQGSGSVVDALHLGKTGGVSNVLTGAGQGSGFLNLGKGGLTAAGQGSGQLVDALHLGKAGEVVGVVSGSGSGVLHAGRDITNVLSGAGSGAGILDLNRGGLAVAGQGAGSLMDTLKLGQTGAGGISNVLTGAGSGAGFLDLNKGGLTAAGHSMGSLTDTLHLGQTGGLTSVLSGAGAGSGLLHAGRDIVASSAGKLNVAGIVAAQGSGMLDASKHGVFGSGEGSVRVGDLKVSGAGVVVAQ